MNTQKSSEPSTAATKQPCLYPLPDGRRCCECDTCQGHDRLAACTCGQRHTTWTNDKDVSNEGHSVACPANPQFAKPSAAITQEEPRVVYDPGRSASVTLTLTLEQTQAVFDRLYVYETDPGYLDREIVARRLRESGAVQVDA